jgi:hypothetical protein
MRRDNELAIMAPSAVVRRAKLKAAAWFQVGCSASTCTARDQRIGALDVFAIVETTPQLLSAPHFRSLGAAQLAVTIGGVSWW